MSEKYFLGQFDRVTGAHIVWFKEHVSQMQNFRKKKTHMNFFTIAST